MSIRIPLHCMIQIKRLDALSSGWQKSYSLYIAAWGSIGKLWKCTLEVHLLLQ